MQRRLQFGDDGERDRLGRGASEIEAHGRTQPRSQPLGERSELRVQPFAPCSRTEQTDIWDVADGERGEVAAIRDQVVAHHHRCVEPVEGDDGAWVSSIDRGDSDRVLEACGLDIGRSVIYHGHLPTDLRRHPYDRLRIGARAAEQQRGDACGSDRERAVAKCRAARWQHTARRAAVGIAAERAANKGTKIDFATVKSVAHVAAHMKPDANGYVMVNGRRVRVIAAKAPVTKKKASKAAAEKPRDEGPTDAQIAAIKTRLVAKELAEYRKILLEARVELIARVTGLEDDALRSSGGNLSNMPLHMADIGTDTFDQDLAIGMAETERELLREIDEALDRITAKTYGVCQLTGKPIPKARLDAKPWAKYTIEAARQLEKMGGR